MSTGTITISTVDYQPGTSVGLYPASEEERWRRGGVPAAASPMQTQTVAADRTVTFTALEWDTDYFAYAVVSGQNQWVSLRTPLRPVGTDIPGPVGPAGPTGPTGPTGPGGPAQYANAWDLSPTPASVTDWGPLINAAITAGVRRLVFQNRSGTGRTRYPLATAIPLSGINGMVFEGETGWSWNRGPDVYLDWTPGAGTGPAFTTPSDPGGEAIQFVNLGLTYANAAFNGTLVKVDHPSAFFYFDRCYIGGSPWTGGTTPTLAFCLLDLREAVDAKVLRCSLQNAKWGIRGYPTNSIGNPNDIVIRENTFGSLTIACLGNPGLAWTIEHNTIEYGGFGGLLVPAFIDEDHTTPSGSRTISLHLKNNRHWDFSPSNAGPFVHQAAKSTWDFTAENEWHYGTNVGQLMKFDGSGHIRITGTTPGRPMRASAGYAPYIDVGDAATVDGKKSTILIRNNFWYYLTSADDGVPVANLSTGHGPVIDVEHNGLAQGAMVTVNSPRRLSYEPEQSTAKAYATIAAHSGVTHWEFIEIGGNNAEGLILAKADGSGVAAGIVLDVTLHSGALSDANTADKSASSELRISVPIVDVEPVEITGVSNGNASRACNATSVVAAADPSHFQIRIANAIPASTTVAWHWRVVHY